MHEEENNNNFYDEFSSRPVPSRPSLFKTLEEVKKQVDFETFAQKLPAGNFYTDPLINEICLIIAEVYIKSPESIIRIQSEDMETAFVQEVYRELRANHIELVADNFKRQTNFIRKKKPYLQTALYNVLFDIDAHYTNLVRHNRNI